MAFLSSFSEKMIGSVQAAASFGRQEFKMLALKKKMEAKNTAATQPAAPSTAAEGQTKQTSGQFQLSKQPSKDLADLRAKTTATTGVFGLAKKGAKGVAAGQKSAAELRAQKGS